MSLPRGVIGSGWMLDFCKGAWVHMATSGAVLDLTPLLLDIFGAKVPGPSGALAPKDANKDELEFAAFSFQGVRFHYRGRAVSVEEAMSVVARYARAAGLLEGE